MLADPFGIDQRLRDDARKLVAFRRALRRGVPEDHVFEAVDRATTRELVLELREAGETDPTAPALLRWAYRIHLERSLVKSSLAIARALRQEPHPLERPEQCQLTLRAILERVIERERAPRALFVSALFEHGQKLGALRLVRWEEHAEVVSRLGFEGGDALELPGSAVLDVARRFLTETDAAFDALGARTLDELVALAVGADSRAAWPARLTTRSLVELIGDPRFFSHVTLDLGELGGRHGASSFLRGFAALGGAWRAALAPETLPFSVARDAFGLERATAAGLFASMPFAAAFAQRALGLSRDGVRDHQRVLARVALVGLREAALRVLLRAPALAGPTAYRAAFVEETARALGVEVPDAAAGVLFTPELGDAQRFAGWLLAAERAERLQREHDEDWYRNPRAVDELVELSRQAAPTTAEQGALEAGATALVGRLNAGA